MTILILTQTKTLQAFKSREQCADRQLMKYNCHISQAPVEIYNMMSNFHHPSLTLKLPHPEFMYHIWTFFTVTVGKEFDCCWSLIWIIKFCIIVRYFIFFCRNQLLLSTEKLFAMSEVFWQVLWQKLWKHDEETIQRLLWALLSDTSCLKGKSLVYKSAVYDRWPTLKVPYKCPPYNSNLIHSSRQHYSQSAQYPHSSDSAHIIQLLSVTIGNGSLIESV